MGKAGLGAAFEFGGILMAKSRAKRRRERLREAAPDDVLMAHRKNFEIPYSQVTKAELGDPNVVATGTLTLTTVSDTHEFTLTEGRLPATRRHPEVRVGREAHPRLT